MQEKMRALKKLTLGILLIYLKVKVHVGCKWVCTVKLKLNGTMDRYKTRLVAKGHTYQKMFTSVTKLSSIQVILSLVANQCWAFLQLDVKNAFLHGDLVEEVYIKVPPGLKQSPWDLVQAFFVWQCLSMGIIKVKQITQYLSSNVAVLLLH